MRRSFLTIAVASSLVAWAGAAAAQSSVTLYGLLDVSGGVQQAEGGTQGHNVHSTEQVLSNDSYVGLRGAEDLGQGLKAIFQIEAGVNVTGDSNPFGTSSSKSVGNNFGTRNSFVGLSDRTLGTVRLGNYDSPYKRADLGLDPFDDRGQATVAGILGNNPFNPYGYNDGSFNRRLKNSVSYDSPVLGGWALNAAVATGHDGDDADDVETSNDRVYSVATTYQGGPLMASLAYERHAGAGASLGNIASNSDDGIKGAIGYLIGPAKIGVIAEELKFRGNDLVPDGATTYQRFAVGLTGTYALTPRADLMAAYVHANDGSFNNGVSANGLGADQVSLEGDYKLSKRTTTYAYYTRIANHGAAQYDFGDNPLGVSPGSDPQAVGVGLRHAF